VKPSALPSAQNRFHHAGGFASHAAQHVAVGVERYGDEGVLEQFLDELRMDILLE